MFFSFAYLIIFIMPTLEYLNICIAWDGSLFYVIDNNTQMQR
jgi:hypothetical protein